MKPTLRILPPHVRNRRSYDISVSGWQAHIGLVEGSRTKRNKELLMVKTALYAAIGFAAISSIASAEDLSSATAPLPPGTFTTSAHSDEWKIANALSAGPASVTEHAAVIDWTAKPKDVMAYGGRPFQSYHRDKRRTDSF